MGEAIVTALFWGGVLMIGIFVVLGLASPRFRALLQRPAADMLRSDRERWGAPVTDEKEKR